MDFDENKVDEATLALIWLNRFKDYEVFRAWKGFDWDAMNRLHEKGFISNPVGKAKSVVITEDGEKRAAELFEKLFGLSD